MERRRAMFSRLLFYSIGGADNRRRGQREERTRTARRTPGGEGSYMVATKQGSITFKREVLIKRVEFILKGRL